MRDGDEIEAPLELVAKIGFGHGLLGPGKDLVGHRLLVDRAGHRIAHRRQGAQIRDDAVEIARSENPVETARHDRCEVVPRGARALLQRGLDLGIAPIADAGLAIRRNVGGRDIERGLVETQSSGERPIELRPIGPHRRMAVVTGHDGVDEIASTLERRLRQSDRRSHKRSEHAKNHATIHHLPSLVCPTGTDTSRRPSKRAARALPLASFTGPAVTPGRPLPAAALSSSAPGPSPVPSLPCRDQPVQ